MPAEDYGPKLIVNTETGEETLVALEPQEVIERDALAAIAAAFAADFATKEAYLVDANNELLNELLGSGWLLNNIVPIYRDRNRTASQKRADIRTEVTALSTDNKFDLLADILMWSLAIVILNAIVDPLDDLGGS